MNTALYRLITVLVLATAAGVAAWKILPGSQQERVALETLTRGFINPPFFIGGKGTVKAPWTFQIPVSYEKKGHQLASTVIAIKDDPHGFFQSSPPAPVDLAVIFSNFLRLGKTQLACATVLKWESPDPIGLGALEKVLTRFDSLVMAAPLTRGAVPSVIPPSFRRSSVAESTVVGNLENLPRVNKTSILGQILGGESALAGFSYLESEAPGDHPHLLARWENRVVFSFELVAALQQLKIPLDRVKIHLGEHIQLGSGGNFIPIDPYGRLLEPLIPSPPFSTISAESLIDTDSKAFPTNAPEPVILRDDQSAAEPSTRAFSKKLSSTVASLARYNELTAPETFLRLPQGIELACLSFIIGITGLLTRTTNELRALGGLIICGVVFSAQSIALGMFSIWLPGLAMVCALLTGLFFSYQRPRKLNVIDEQITN